MPENIESLLARIDEKTINIDKNLSAVVEQINIHSTRISNIEINCARQHGEKGDRGDTGKQGIQGIQGLSASKGLLAIATGGNTVLFIVILLLLRKFGIL